MRLQRTWIEGFDEQVGGGFPDGSLVLLLGEVGSGNCLFARQILYNHAMRGGGVIYFALDWPPKEVVEEMTVYGMDVTRFLQDGRWVFLDAHGPKRGKPAAASDALDSLKEEYVQGIGGAVWSAIESLSQLILMYGFRNVLDHIEAVQFAAREKGGLHFLLANPSIHDQREVALLEHLSDIVLHFSQREVRGGDILNLIRVKKIKRGFFTPKIIPFEITPHGISVETAVRIP